MKQPVPQLIYLPLYLLIFLAFVLRSAVAQQPTETAWTLCLDQSGIQVFTRPMQGNPIDEFKAVTRITGDIDSAFAIVSDLSRFISTDPYTVSTEILTKSDSNVFYFWNEMKTPFFMKNRDMVSRLHTSKTTNGYIIVTEAQPDYAPERPGLVRIQRLGVLVSLQPIGNGVFELIYKGYLYPTADFTANYANKAVVGSAFERLMRLRQLLLSGLSADQH